MEFSTRTTTWDYTDGSAGLAVVAQHQAGGGSQWTATLRVGNAAFRAQAASSRAVLEALILEAPGRYTPKLRNLIETWCPPEVPS